ncbi:LCP family protein, partial [Brachybacterium hainanense]
RARPRSSARPVPTGASRPEPREQQRAWQSAGHGGVHHRPPEEEDPRTAAEELAEPRRERRPSPSRRRGVSRIPRPVRLGATLLALLLVIGCGWFGGLALWADSRIEHVDALSEAADTPGTTWLIAGSDRRDGAAVSEDGTTGQRADTMMLLHKADNGRTYLVSLPRDTLVDIPGHGGYKLNAAYAFGGPSLLVQTVEQFTGLTIDHYVEVGFDGVTGVVDAVGTVNLCIDRDVDDEKSGLKMTEGCHDVGGEQALAFVRARYFDPTADLGRQQRQQQFVGALMDRVTSPGVLLNPVTQARLAGAGSGSLRTSEGTGLVDVGRMGLAMRGAMKGGPSLQMPIEDPEYHTKHSGVAILTDEEDIAAFFGAIQDGTAEPPAA